MRSSHNFINHQLLQKQSTMHKKHNSFLPNTVLVVLLGLQTVTMNVLGQTPGPPPGPGQGGGRGPTPIDVPIQSDTTRTLNGYFTPATSAKKTPDAGGFIQ